jgi:8-oxo-dGTP pyrophosphatase MutT (NUDIX family)
MKIGAIAVIPYSHGFLGLQCAKGRGLILPGGTYEREKDSSYQDTAIRETVEEVGVIPHGLQYIWHGPDGGDYTTFAFLANWYSGEPRASNEGVPQVVQWDDLFKSDFGAYYLILYEIMERRCYR